MVGEIVVGGVRHPVAVPVTTWHASGLGFPGLPMRDRAGLVVLCSTGIDSTAAMQHKALQTKRDKDTGKPLELSAHFHVDALGICTQYADALARCKGVGNIGNKRGCLIDLSNRSDPNRSVRGITRELVVDKINNETAVRTTFTAPQMRAALALIEGLCAALGIPCVVPMSGPHVIPHALPIAVIETFEGVVGRLHLDPRRYDPGLAVLRALAAKSIRKQAESDG